MSDTGKNEDMERVEAACRALGEHFDSVQIFVTRHEPFQRDGTVNINVGEGNWFTRYGQVSDWMIRQNERTRDYIREDERKDRE